MNIEKGMYTRSKVNGMIGKVTDIEYKEDGIYDRYILNNNHNLGFMSSENYQVKASYNIIDLIEVGDLVNGCIVD